MAKSPFQLSFLPTISLINPKHFIGRDLKNLGQPCLIRVIGKDYSIAFNPADQRILFLAIPIDQRALMFMISLDFVRVIINCRDFLGCRTCNLNKLLNIRGKNLKKSNKFDLNFNANGFVRENVK
jgi:hypothetical protein